MTVIYDRFFIYLFFYPCRSKRRITKKSNAASDLDLDLLKPVTCQVQIILQHGYCCWPVCVGDTAICSFSYLSRSDKLQIGTSENGVSFILLPTFCKTWVACQQRMCCVTIYPAYSLQLSKVGKQPADSVSCTLKSGSFSSSVAGGLHSWKQLSTVFGFIPLHASDIKLKSCWTEWGWEHYGHVFFWLFPPNTPTTEESFSSSAIFFTVP